MSDEPQPSTTDIDPQMQTLIGWAEGVFLAMAEERHKKGAIDYGEFTWLQNDTFKMLLEELVDVSNYARMNFIKVLLLALDMEEITDGEYGIGGFRGAGAFWQPAQPKEQT